MDIFQDSWAIRLYIKPDFGDIFSKREAPLEPILGVNRIEKHVQIWYIADLN